MKRSLSFFAFLFIIVFGVILLNNNHEAEPEPTHQERFIETLKQAMPEETSVFPSVIMAQAILESQWGQSQLSADAHNYFGIKTSSADQDAVLVPTQEFIDGEMQDTEDSFRRFDSLNASIHGYLELMQLERYDDVRDATSYSDAAQALYEGGYATDPDYAKKIVELIESYRLYIYDEH